MWALRRRLLIIAIVLLFFAALVAGALLIKRVTEQPLCTDNKQNGSETGIDCGGVCARVCPAETVPLFVNWARVVPVTDKVYSIALQVENRNYDAVAYRASYTCNIQTADFRSVQKVSDTISVPPAGKYYFAVPSLRFASADVRPERVDCFFDSRHEWLRLPKKTTPIPFDFQSINLSVDDRPTLSAILTNTDNMRTFKNIVVTAVVYDRLETVVATSTTTVTRITPTSSENLVFTWPSIFKGVEPYRAELTPVFDFPDYAKK